MLTGALLFFGGGYLMNADDATLACKELVRITDNLINYV